MSASAPRNTGIKNPATKFIKWKAGTNQGYFEYYDKSEEDPKNRSKIIDLSPGFFVLDKDLFSITGFIDTKPPTNIISNEVREIDDILTVKGFKDKKAETLLHGPYSELKSTVSGSKTYAYTRSVYIKFEGELVHVALSGAAFASWLNGVESNSKFNNSLIRMSGVGKGNKGNVSWLFPEFEVVREATDEEWEQVVDLDSKVLQPYLEWYLAKNKAGGATKPSSNQQSEDSFDIKDWRHFKLPTGSRLCDLTYYQIMELSDSMIGEGDVDSVQFNCVSQAVVDYNQASKQWESKKDKTGRMLSDYSADEVNEVLAKVSPDNPVKMFLELAKAAKEETSSEFADDEEIPF